MGIQIHSHAIAKVRSNTNAVGKRWRMDETNLKVKDQWRHLYLAAAKEWNTAEFLLTKVRQRLSAQSYLIKAIDENEVPDITHIDKSGLNTGAIKVYNKWCYTSIEIRQCKNLNNMVEQDHRYIKWRLQRGLSFKDFESARGTTGVIKVVQMIRKGQVEDARNSNDRTFYSLVG